MVEADGDGGTRQNRSQRTTVDTSGGGKGRKASEDGKPANQRNMRPKAKGATSAKGGSAKKPMRASEDEETEDFEE